MSVKNYVTGDKFVIRVIKSLATNPDREWTNSWEFVALESGTEATLLALGDSVVAFEKAITFANVNFTRLLVSTWEADSKPYDPDVFLASALTGTGDKTSPTDPLPLSQCLSIARGAATGRLGHVFMRGCMQESDVGAPAGKPVLVNKAGFQGDVDDAITSSGLGDAIGGAAVSFFMALINKDGSQVRKVLGLVVVGVSQLPVDHAWFNRPKTPPSP